MDYYGPSIILYLQLSLFLFFRPESGNSRFHHPSLFLSYPFFLFLSFSFTFFFFLIEFRLPGGSLAPSVLNETVMTNLKSIKLLIIAEYVHSNIGPVHVGTVRINR